MHWEKSAPAERAVTKPYQGVRVKDPVKELLRRKRGSDIANAKPAHTTTVVVPNTANALSSYTQIAGSVGFSEVGTVAEDRMVVDDGTLCSGWIAQPAAAALQPVAHWASPEFLPGEHNASAYTTDVYVQPVCPSYTVVGPPSMLTYTHTPLFTNFGTRPSSSQGLPQVDLLDSSLAYLPWAQPLATFSAPTMQCPPCTAPFSTTQVPSQPMTVEVPEPDPERLEQARNVVTSLPLEKLLEEDDDKDTYVTDSSLFIQDV
ncbi:POU domain class 2-associating factor 1 [Arapaima gigas]